MATLYPLLASCRLHGVNPVEWLEDVLPRMAAAHPAKEIHLRLPSGNHYISWYLHGRLQGAKALPTLRYWPSVTKYCPDDLCLHTLAELRGKAPYITITHHAPRPRC